MSGDHEGSENPRQADEKFCFSCGMRMHVTAANCPRCGAMQANGGGAPPGAIPWAGTLPARVPRASEVFCRGCGNPINAAAPYCPACGAPQPGAALASGDIPEKSRIAAGLLAIFVGGLGVHKFYLGEVGLGVLYLLFSWTLIPALVGLIEGIYYLCMSDARFARRFH